MLLGAKVSKVAEHSVTEQFTPSAEIRHSKARKNIFLTQADLNSEERAARFTLEQAPH